MNVQERTRKRPRSISEYSNSAIKRTRIDPRFTSLSSEHQYIKSKAASSLQVPSGVVPIAPSNLSSGFQPSGDNFHLFTQQPQQTQPPSSTTRWISVPEQNTQPSAGGCEKPPTHDLSLTTNMYCSESFCLPDFGFAR